ncbi:S-layer homology domain-containing protein [Microbacterium sp. A93]|uniref:S-layer homology domain-containing protein n=1 Tax=Microbacterium sp. A93 TaxID=3450716 RepID=UPI003F421973
MARSWCVQTLSSGAALALLVLLGSPPALAATPIPDPAFRDCLTTAAASAGVTLANLEGASCDAADGTIRDLTGAEQLTSLEALFLDGHQVSDLSPLSGLPQLHRLEVPDNSVRDLAPLAGMTQLTNLNLSGNDIRDVGPLEDLTDLVFLTLDGNAIEDVEPLAGLSKLSFLGLAQNQITYAGYLSSLSQANLALNLEGQHTQVDIDHAGVTHLPQVRDSARVPVYPVTCGGPAGDCLHAVERNGAAGGASLDVDQPGTYVLTYQGDDYDHYSLTLTVQDQEGEEFPDVPSTHPFHGEISWLAAEGISIGYADGTFRPNRDVTRGEMVTFLYRLAGSPAHVPPVESPFTDVSTTSPDYTAITWAAQQEITTGFTDGTFGRSAHTTRGQMAAFIYRFDGSPAFTPPATSPFEDVGVSATFYRPITWLVSEGITRGYANGLYGMNDQVTRGQMAAFLYRLCH